MAPPSGHNPLMLTDFPKDLLLTILSSIGFGGLYYMCKVSKHFDGMLRPAIRSLYGVKCSKTTYMYYTTILNKFDDIQMEAYKKRPATKAMMILQNSLEFMSIKEFLEAKFGSCTRYWENRQQFITRLPLLVLLESGKRISALPYLLDQDLKAPQWASCIQALHELERFDLLGLLEFRKIETSSFYLLLSIPLPTFVVVAAAKSLRNREPNSELSRMITLAILQEGDACIPEGPVPLYILQHMHENRMTLPENLILTEGLLERSISFWIYLIKRGVEEFQKLLSVIIEFGDANTKCLASIFYRLVPSEVIPVGTEDVYHAILIRFCFSPHSNGYVKENYEKLIERSSEISHHTVNALLDCGQSEQIGQFKFRCNSLGALEGLLAKMHRLGDKNLSVLVKSYLDENAVAPDFLKILIKQRAADWYIQLVWDWLRLRMGYFDTVERSCCLLPIETLKSLVLEEDISVAAVQDMLGEVRGYVTCSGTIPMEVALVYIVMFWEAPEKVLVYFLDQLAPHCRLKPAAIWQLRWSAKYSLELWRRLFKHCGKLAKLLKPQIKSCRPDLLCLFN